MRPSLDVNGIWGGYIEEGTKTIIPARASAKISMRLVPNQDFRKIAKLFERYFRAIAPRSVKVDVRFLHGGAPYVSPTDLPAYKAAEKAVEATFGKKPLPFYSGGSIPIVSAFEEILGVKSILLGFVCRGTRSTRPTRVSDWISSSAVSRRSPISTVISRKCRSERFRQTPPAESFGRGCFVENATLSSTVIRPRNCCECSPLR